MVLIEESFIMQRVERKAEKDQLTQVLFIDIDYGEDTTAAILHLIEYIDIFFTQLLSFSLPLISFQAFLSSPQSCIMWKQPTISSLHGSLKRAAADSYCFNYSCDCVTCFCVSKDPAQFKNCGNAKSNVPGVDLQWAIVA